MPEGREELIQEMVRRLGGAVHPDKIILFGSHARGEAGPESDVDVMIVAPSDLPVWKRAVPVYRALRGMPLAKDVLWRTPEEVQDRRGVQAQVISTALREGKVSYDRAS